MPFIALGAGLMWYGIVFRVLALRRGTRLPMHALVARANAHPDAPTWGVLDKAAARAVRVKARKAKARRLGLEVAIGPLRDRLSRFSTAVRSVSVLAPLLGLLGTVGGMIETFDHLGAVNSQVAGGGSMGAGISEALVSTQAGLVVAVPGMLLGTLLMRRQRRLEDELDQLVEYVSVKGLTS